MDSAKPHVSKKTQLSLLFRNTIFGGYGDSIDKNFQWVEEISKILQIRNVGFIQTYYYGSTPNLQIDYYRSDTDANVLSQASTGSTNGVFEYWDGSTWTSGLGTDTINIRRRFRPTAALPSGVNLYTRLKII